MLNRNGYIHRLALIANAIGIVALFLLLAGTLLIQYILKENPCPLCLLQRAGLLMTAAAFLLNLRFGLRPSHYALALMSALFTSLVALRQISLHVIPGTGSFGSAILGWHLYTWSFIIALVFIFFITLLFSADAQYFKAQIQSNPVKMLLILVCFSTLALATVHFISVLELCGVSECPENPDVLHKR